MGNLDKCIDDVQQQPNQSKGIASSLWNFTLLERFFSFQTLPNEDHHKLLRNIMKPPLNVVYVCTVKK
jgi:hypothetical protein